MRTLIVSLFLLGGVPHALAVPICKPLKKVTAAECKSLSATACFERARGYYFIKDDGARDPAKALLLFRAACHLGHGLSCLSAARKDKGCVAFQYYLMACRAGEAEGCMISGNWLIDGGAAEGVRPDPRRGGVLLEWACRAGRDLACADLAHYYREGIGVKKDLAKARTFQERAEKLGFIQEGNQDDE